MGDLRAETLELMKRILSILLAVDAVIIKLDGEITKF